MKILKSRVFWTAVTDATVGIIFLILGNFYPQYKELAVQVWALLQPIVGVILLYYTSQDIVSKVTLALRGEKPPK